MIALQHFPRRRAIVMHALLALLIAWTAASVTYAVRFWSIIPVLNASTFALPQSIVVTDRYGRELIRFFGEKDIVELQANDIPQHVRDAFVMIEDRRFWTRACIDTRALLRAGTTMLLSDRIEGASTITQQLVGVFLENRSERTVRRKINEILLACRMEWSMPKEDILTLYLNNAPFGGNVYGIEQASTTFFGIHARDLSIAQAAILAALPQRPTSLSPFGSGKTSKVTPEARLMLESGEAESVRDLPEGSWTLGLLGLRFRMVEGGFVLLPGRADLVLTALKEAKSITQIEYRDAEEDLRRMRFKQAPAAEPEAEFFVRQIRQEIPHLLASTPELRAKRWSGLTIRTTLDSDLQRLAQRVIAEHADAFRQRFNVQNISLVAIDRQTREVIAYVGNVSAEEQTPGREYDMADVPRQPGSSFKPFVYAAAFEAGMLSPGSRILDGPLWIGNTKPRNYEGGYWGWMFVRNALAASRNIPAIRAFLMAGGEDAVLNAAASAGITRPLEERTNELAAGSNFTYGWPLAIGAAEIPLWQMVQGYATIANDGAMLPIRSVLAVTQAEDDESLLEIPQPEVTHGMDSETAQELRDILKNPTLRPAGGWRKMLDTGEIETAAKTGTSNQCRGVDVRTGQCVIRLPSDTWTMGFSPSLVVGVWAGNASFAALAPDADGLDVAAPIWREFIVQAHALKPEMITKFEPAGKKLPLGTAVSVR